MSDDRLPVGVQHRVCSRRAVVVGLGAGVLLGGGGGVAGGQNEEGEDEGGEEAEGEDEAGEEEEDGDADEEANGDENGDDAETEAEDEPEPNGGTETILVDDNFYDPDSLTIQPGTTVVWEWVGEVDHNINPEDQPDEADWEGHLELQTTGEHEFTFEVEGEYNYICDPHVGVGMVGDITVDADAAAGGEEIAEVVPEEAWTLIIATVAAMVGTLALVYLFMHFGGVSE